MSDYHDPNAKKSADMHQMAANEIQSETAKPLEQPPYHQPDMPLRQPTSKRPLWLLPVMVLVLMVGVIVGKYWGSSTDNTQSVASGTQDKSNTADTQVSTDANHTEQTVLSVETVTPSQDSIGNTLMADGTISAKDIANVSAKVNGVAIERILVEEGERVNAGQVLALFDTDAMQQQVLQAEAEVAEAEATLTNASADAARVLPLLTIDAISAQEADRYRTAKLRAKAALQASKARLNTQRLSVGNAQVIAPVSGIISEKLAEVGMVATGSAIFTIIKDGVLEWQADIDPKLLGDVIIGTPVKVSLPQAQAVMGKVRRIAPTADDNRQITIYASLDTNAGARAGMYQTGEFLLGSANMQTVPNSAIVSNDGYDYVMLVTTTKTTRNKTLIGRIQQQRVSLGERIGDKVTLTKPLPADSQLVKQGGSFLNDGDWVRVVDELNGNTTTQASS